MIPPHDLFEQSLWTLSHGRYCSDLFSLKIKKRTNSRMRKEPRKIPHLNQV